MSRTGRLTVVLLLNLGLVAALVAVGVSAAALRSPLAREAPAR